MRSIYAFLCCPLLYSPLAECGIWEQKPLAASTSCEEACSQISQLLPDRTLHDAAAKIGLWSQFQAQVTPRCRVQPLNAKEVADILDIVRRKACHFAVLGGGTSPFRGGSNAEGGVTIDLVLMKGVKLLDLDGQDAVRVGGGAVWADVYRELDPFNLSSTGTRNSLTGVVGSILGGGISFFSQREGWICDNALDFKIVLANSSIVHANELTNSDLFWALRGGGSNFGVITEVVLRVFTQPESWYTFQRWNMANLLAVFQRLDSLSRNMPTELQMISTNLGWSTWLKDFVLTERLVASNMPKLPKALPSGNSTSDGATIPVMEEHVYKRTTLKMSQVMDLVNEEGYFNFFGSTTVKSNPDMHVRIAKIFQDEASRIVDCPGIKVYIVYNPVTVETIKKMKIRGGNTLGIEPPDGPLTIVNINMHWSDDSDTPRMRLFMTQMIARIQKTAKMKKQHHPYLFLSHSYEEQEPLLSYGEDNLRRLHQVRQHFDPDGLFQLLQIGTHKLGMVKAADSRDLKTEL